jgi:alkanesulfonate monooxygenase SsuD/methylene tetrahydromethanopterin reductase-like flavin-dependent oxidoreductase (luciferase family)
MITTLDILSNGRIVVGIGVGWSQVGFDGYSEWNGPKVRVDKTQEGLELMMELWIKDEVSFDGKYYKANGAVLKPKPVQRPYSKFLFGGLGNRMLALVGRYGDIMYIPPFRESQRAKEGKKIVRQAAERRNRIDEIAFMSGNIVEPFVMNT